MEITEPGVYLAKNRNKDQFLLLVTGKSPFLKYEKVIEFYTFKEKQISTKAFVTTNSYTEKLKVIKKLC